MTLKHQRNLVKIGLIAFLVFGLLVSFYHYTSEMRGHITTQHNGRHPAVVNIGYLRVPNDEMIAIQEGTIKKKLESLGIKVKFLVFDSGVEANKALAAGSIDFASMGVTNGVVALSKGLDVELIWLHGLLGTNEALVMRKDQGVVGLNTLAGKTIATTFASTSHYSLQKVLEANHLTDKVKVLDMTTLDIAAAWQRGNIDGAYTWDPVLSKLVSDNGKVLISSADLVAKKITTANVMLGRKGFTHQYKKITALILSAISKANTFYQEKPEEAAKIVAQSLEISKDEALYQMKGTIWLSAKEQMSKDYLGNNQSRGQFADVIAEISQFLYRSKSIANIPDQKSIEEFLNSRYITLISESEGER